MTTTPCFKFHPTLINSFVNAISDPKNERSDYERAVVDDFDLTGFEYCTDHSARM